MAMHKFGAYTDDSGVVVSEGDSRKKKDDGVTGKAIKTAEDRLGKMDGKQSQVPSHADGIRRQQQ